MTTNDAPQQIRKRIRIGDLLVEHGLITAEQLQQALAEQKRSGRRIGRVLVEMRLIDDEDLHRFLSRQLDLPYVDLATYRYMPDVARALPETHARRFRTLLLELRDDEALVGMSDPTDLFAHDELARLLGRPVRQALVRETDLLTALDQVYRRSAEISNLAEELDEELSIGSADETDLQEAESAASTDDAPVMRLLRTLFEDAVQVQASDIHIEPDEQSLRIRQRVDGVLQEHVMKEARIAPALILRLKLMAGLNISERRLPQDGRFNVRVRNRSIDVRLSTMPIQHGESVVMRLLDQSAGLLNLEQLGMPPAMLVRFRRLLRRPHGMILVTGPTGSGKTTTLYAALSELNDPSRKIITVEDPVEYRIPRVNQVQVREPIGLTFGRVLRSALRQDPDIVLVGEIRDQETAEIGLRAAVTGHLVLSTLHTNDAVSTAVRLLDMGVESFLLAASLRAIIAQRLLRQVCDNCSESHVPDQDERDMLVSLLGEGAADGGFHRGRGCNRCNQTGYRGRIGVYEMLELSGAMADALRRNDLTDFAQLAQSGDQFHSLGRAALDYARRGITSLDEVLRVAGEVDESRVDLSMQAGGDSPTAPVDDHD
ncbi:MAG: GspE/PulE family protein [Aquisalimonadaceae bacterium]